MHYGSGFRANAHSESLVAMGEFNLCCGSGGLCGMSGIWHAINSLFENHGSHHGFSGGAIHGTGPQ